MKCRATRATRALLSLSLSLSLTLSLSLSLVAPSVNGVARRAPVPGSTCQVFPPDNAWRIDVSKLPVHAKNDVWRRTTHARSTMLHPDFGAPPYGMPYAVVDDSTPTEQIDFGYADESDDVEYPLTASTPLEGGSDRHALIINSDTCVLYELWNTDWNSGNPTAGSGAVFDLGSNDLRPAGWTSADAAGLPVFPGLVRYDEVQAGIIDHAIRFTVACTRNRYLWPARHHAATGGRRCPPMGARFRLKAGFDTNGFGSQAEVVLTAMKTYGLIVADNGSDWYFQGTMDADWSDAALDEMKTVPARAFVAVDVSGCRVAQDSAVFAYGAGCPSPS